MYLGLLRSWINIMTILHESDDIKISAHIKDTKMVCWQENLDNIK